MYWADYRLLVTELAKMALLFVALCGYDFALNGQATVSRTLVMLFFAVAVRVLVRGGILNRSKPIGLFLLTGFTVVGAWIGYAADPPDYSLLGHVLLGLGASAVVGLMPYEQKPA